MSSPQIVTKRNFNSCSGNNTSSVSDDKNTWHRLHDRLLKAPCVTDRYWLIPLNFIQIALKPHSGPVFPTFDNSEKIKNQNQPKGYQKSEVREKKRGINWKSIEIFKFQFLSKSVENFKS